MVDYKLIYGKIGVMFDFGIDFFFFKLIDLKVRLFGKVHSCSFLGLVIWVN